MKVALVGYGYWGEKLAASFKLLVKGAESLVIFDPFKHQNGYTSWSKLLTDPQLTHVILATPEQTHSELATNVLMAKKHLLVEKPMALTRTEAHHITQLALKQKKCLLVDYTFLYDEEARLVKSILEQNIIGTLIEVESIRYSAGFSKPALHIPYDLAIHDLYLYRTFFGQSATDFRIQSAVKSKGFVQATAGTLLASQQPPWRFFYSWLEPHSIRKMILTGQKARIIWSKGQGVQVVDNRDQLIPIPAVPQTVLSTSKSALELLLDTFISQTNRKSSFNTRRDQKRYIDYVTDTAMLESLSYACATF